MHIQWEIKSWDELSIEEFYEIIALRIRVFIIEQNCPYQDADGKDKLSYHLFAKNENGQCIACLRIVQPGISYEEWSIGRVATDLTIRRCGFGKSMMAHALRWLDTKYNNPSIRISAQAYLLSFYQEFGFTSIGKEYLEDGIPHVEMVRVKK